MVSCYFEAIISRENIVVDVAGRRCLPATHGAVSLSVVTVLT